MKLLENLLCRQNEVIHAGIQWNQLELYSSSSVINTCNTVLTQGCSVNFHVKDNSYNKVYPNIWERDHYPLQAGWDKGH